MALFENYPYTNIHNLNMDEVLRKVKNLEQAFTNMNQIIADHVHQMVIDGTLPNVALDYLRNAPMVGTPQISNQLQVITDGYDPTRYTLQELYSMYDALGLSGDALGSVGGLSIRCYKRKADIFQDGGADGNTANWDKYNALTQCKPTMILMAGIHGNEKSSITALYSFVKHICLDNSPECYLLRNCIDLVIVPVINVYGYEHDQRRNENNVDLNRNFPFGFNKETYPEGGNNPADQKETQLIIELLEQYKGNSGAVVIDCHDFVFRDHPDRNICWFSTGDRAVRSKVASVMEEIKRCYDMAEDLPPYGVFGRLNAPGSQPTLDNYVYHIGLNGTLCEVPKAMNQLELYSMDTARIAYMIISNTCVHLAGECFSIDQNTIISRLEKIGCTNDSNLTEVCDALPAGCIGKFYLLSNSGALWNSMPQYRSNQSAGILEIIKANSFTNQVANRACIIRWTTAAGANVYEFINSLSATGALKPWRLTTARTVTGYDLPEGAKLKDVVAMLADGEKAVIYCSNTEQSDLFADCPSDGHAGILEINKSIRLNGNIMFTASFTDTGYATVSRWVTSGTASTVNNWSKL